MLHKIGQVYEELIFPWYPTKTATINEYDLTFEKARDLEYGGDQLLQNWFY